MDHQPAPARPGQIVGQTFWETHLFLCDWPEQPERGPRVADLIRGFAEDLDAPVASGVGLSAKPGAGLVESPLNFFECCADADMTALTGWIDGCLRLVVAEVNGGGVGPDGLRTEFCESWFHITNDGGFHDAHTHDHCSWCGIFYVRAGDRGTAPGGAAGNGVNRFYGPFAQGGMFSADYGNRHRRRKTVDVTPEDGRLVIFPSYLLHSALPYRGATDRIVIAFNTRIWAR